MLPVQYLGARLLTVCEGAHTEVSVRNNRKGPQALTAMPGS